MVWGTPQSVNSRVEWSFDDNDGKYEFVGFIGASNSQNVRNLSPIAFKVAECRYGEVEEEIKEQPQYMGTRSLNMSQISKHDKGRIWGLPQG